MFEVIGERINTSRKKVQEAVAARDAAYIIEDVRRQEKAGAAYIEINTIERTLNIKGERMQWTYL